MGRVISIGVVCAALAACGDDSGGSAEGSGGAMGTGATAGGGSGGNTGMCPTNPNPITSCAGPCPVVDAQLAMICTVACCTASNACGTRNLASGSECSMVTGQDNSSCPDAMVANSVAQGCCVDGVKCGVVDTITNSGCIARESVPLVTLEPINCDGTTPAAGAGM